MGGRLGWGLKVLRQAALAYAVGILAGEVVLWIPFGPYGLVALPLAILLSAPLAAVAVAAYLRFSEAIDRHLALFALAVTVLSGPYILLTLQVIEPRHGLQPLDHLYVVVTLVSAAAGTATFYQLRVRSRAFSL